MITQILLIAGIVISSVGLGFSIGIKRGIEISMQTAIEGVIKSLAEEFGKLGMKDQFKIIVNKVFDKNKLNLWEDEE